jgi:hypothetical protein
MKQSRLIELFVSNKSSNHNGGYTDYSYYRTTAQHKTLYSAIRSLRYRYQFGDFVDIRKSFSGKVGYDGYYRLWARFVKA